MELCGSREPAGCSPRQAHTKLGEYLHNVGRGAGPEELESSPLPLIGRREPIFFPPSFIVGP